MITTAQIQDILDGGATVVGSDGEKIGKVEQVYLDDRSGEPSWVTVKTGLFGTGESFVPLDAATLEGDTIRVPYAKDKIKDAPRIEDAEQSLSPGEEDELYTHYGIGDTGADTYTSAGTTGTDTYASGTTGTAGTTGTTGTDGFATTTAGTSDTYQSTGTTGTDSGRHAAGTVGTGDTDDASVVRSEEEVHVGTREREAGRARLRKYVVTENVTKTVPVQREEVRIEREPVTGADGVSAGDLGDDEASVTLHEDEVVVDKESKPVERVRLGTETVTDQETVTEEVRKEQVETDVDGGTTRY